MKADDENAGSAFGGRKVPWRTGIWILLLTLAVWSFFYVKQAQLDAASTGVVALAVIIFVFAAQWLWSLIRRSKKIGAEKSNE